MVILYADDDEDDRLTFADMLHEIDPKITLIQAEDGLQTIDFLDNIELPDIIFLDINMPVLNGYETLAEIRKDARFKHVKVIMFSTTVYQKGFDKYSSLNARFVSKPSTIKEGVEILRALIDTLTSN
jgi:CheY-like chemotaxis protein